MLFKSSILINIEVFNYYYRSISPFNSINVCFICFGPTVLHTYVYIVRSFSWIDLWTLANPVLSKFHLYQYTWFFYIMNATEHPFYILKTIFFFFIINFLLIFLYMLIFVLFQFMCTHNMLRLTCLILFTDIYLPVSQLSFDSV